MGIVLIPAVVLGIETPIGLGIIRDLGRHGVPVHGLARDPDAVGLSSRYLAKGHARKADEHDLIEQLVQLRAELGEACLFAISESDIAMLNRHRDRLSGYHLMFADAARMESVLNKEQTYAAARKVGIRVPRSEQVASLSEARELSESIRFPVVLKWSNPNEAIRILSRAGLALDKSHYCYSAAELMTYLGPYESVNIFPLIQEYCPGLGLGQMILMQNGQPQYSFQHRRIHEWPPEGGCSTVCESVPLQLHEELMQRSVALLQELKWDGVAMVEYRHDPVTGESALMEINGRFWGSLPLAYHAGACFPWFYYQTHGIGQTLVAKPYVSGMRCRFMIPETKWLFRILFQRSRIADRNMQFKPIPEVMHYFIDFLRPSTSYFVFDSHDPRPFLHDFRLLFVKLFRKIMPGKAES
jgi:predicted ATP-grasp superfamily ATP-dependent carboligase